MNTNDDTKIYLEVQLLAGNLVPVVTAYSLGVHALIGNLVPIVMAYSLGVHVLIGTMPSPTLGCHKNQHK